MRPCGLFLSDGVIAMMNEALCVVVERERESLLLSEREFSAKTRYQS